ncbi:uncharacterized protein DS421_8g248460 [Arachis hypogaea]|nr:uncharacterized protein DS421_8g248460 [Arachis hypogaea]
MEALEMVMLDSMRWLQQENNDAFLVTKESSKVLEHPIVKTDLSTQRLGASFSSSGMKEKAVNSQQGRPPDVHMMVSPLGLIEKKDALWSRILQSKYGGGDWDADKIKEWLPDDEVSKIVAIPTPSPWKDKDQITWALTSDGCFKLKSAYQDIQNISDSLVRNLKSTN